MLISESNQYLYAARGPLDAKALVKTYGDLVDIDNWTIDGTFVAYNGMIVAVWLDSADAANNGIYYLFDPSVTTVLKKPDVTNHDNWHKISDKVDLSGLYAAIERIEERVAAIEDEDKLHTYGYRNLFPSEGQSGHMYVAVDEQQTYVWFNDEYIPVGGTKYEEPTIIFGGDSGV